MNRGSRPPAPGRPRAPAADDGLAPPADAGTRGSGAAAGPGPGRGDDAPKPPPGRPGFSLIELIMVTLVLGILAALALPLYRGYKERAATSSLQSELRTLRHAQELYFVEHDGYTDDLDSLDYTPGSDVVVELRTASGGRGAAGWAGRLRHATLDIRCAVFHGPASPYDPAAAEGSIACDGGD